MVKSEKIKLSVSAIKPGTYTISIEWPNGKQERKEAGYSSFCAAIGITKKLEIQYSEGDNDFYLTPSQYNKFIARLK